MTGEARKLDDEFATWKKANASPPRCSICKLPKDIRAFCHRLRESGEAYDTISGFLKTKGYPISGGAVRNHFVRGDGP